MKSPKTLALALMLSVVACSKKPVKKIHTLVTDFSASSEENGPRPVGEPPLAEPATGSGASTVSAANRNTLIEILVPALREAGQSDDAVQDAEARAELAADRIIQTIHSHTDLNRVIVAILENRTKSPRLLETNRIRRVFQKEGLSLPGEESLEVTETGVLLHETGSWEEDFFQFYAGKPTNELRTFTEKKIN